MAGARRQEVTKEPLQSTTDDVPAMLNKQMGGCNSQGNVAFNERANNSRTARHSVDRMGVIPMDPPRASMIVVDVYVRNPLAGNPLDVARQGLQSEVFPEQQPQMLSKVKGHNDRQVLDNGESVSHILSIRD